MKYFFSPNEADRAPPWTLQTCLEPFSGEQVAYLKAAVCFLTRVCAWPRINPGGRLEKESSLGFWCFSKLLLYHPFQGYVCINTKNLRSSIWRRLAPRRCWWALRGGAGSNHVKAGFVLKLWPKFCCAGTTMLISHCEWWMYCQWSDRNRQKEATLISIAWIREGIQFCTLGSKLGKQVHTSEY